MGIASLLFLVFSSWWVLQLRVGKMETLFWMVFFLSFIFFIFLKVYF